MFKREKGLLSDQSEDRNLPNVESSLGSLSPHDRIKALMYAFRKAKEAGEKGEGDDFDAQAAIAALEMGTLQLRGNQEQIAGQLLLIHAAVGILRRALAYPVTEGQHPALPVEELETLPRPKPIKRAP